MTKYQYLKKNIFRHSLLVIVVSLKAYSYKTLQISYRFLEDIDIFTPNLKTVRVPERRNLRGRHRSELGYQLGHALPEKP